MKKLNTKAGFTLAELLIVVAIIAILVAIGIPVFSTAMERSRETVDLANIRAAYAEFQSGQLSGNGIVGGVYKIDFKQTDGKGWLIDTTGLKNLLATDVAAEGTNPAKYSLDTPQTAGSEKNAVNFWVDAEGKPKMKFVKFADYTTGSETTTLEKPTDYTGAFEIALSDTMGTGDDANKYVFTDGTTTYYLYKKSA